MQRVNRFYIYVFLSSICSQPFLSSISLYTILLVLFVVSCSPKIDLKQRQLDDVV